MTASENPSSPCSSNLILVMTMIILSSKQTCFTPNVTCGSARATESKHAWEFPEYRMHAYLPRLSYVTIEAWFLSNLHNRPNCCPYSFDRQSQCVDRVATVAPTVFATVTKYGQTSNQLDQLIGPTVGPTVVECRQTSNGWPDGHSVWTPL